MPEQNFADRHIGPDAADVATMLDVIGVASLDDLAAKALPANILDALDDSGRAPGMAEAAAGLDLFRRGFDRFGERGVGHDVARDAEPGQ